VSTAAAWHPRHSPWLVAATVMSATFMEVLDTSVANVSLPHIAGNLSCTPEESTWILTSYLVSNAIILPMTGWLGRYVGRKRLFLACIGLFTLTSGLCGMATSLPFLIAARVLQGIGGGAMVPISQAILLESFPPHQRGQAMAAFGMGVIVAPILGPTLGGWITDNYSWRWIFYINIPVGIAALLATEAVVEDPPYIRGGRVGSIDFAGFLFLALWLGTLQIILDRGEQEDWFAAGWIRWFAVTSVVAFVAFLVRQLRTAHPLVDLRVLRYRNFSAGLVLITMLGGVLYGTTAALPIFLQTLLGYPALQSGLVLSPRGVGAFFTTLLVGRLVGKVAGRWLIFTGFSLLSVSSFWLGQINLQISEANAILPVVLSGIAISFVFVPLTTTAMGGLRQDQMGNATGVYNLMRNLGGSLGIAMVTTFLARHAQIEQANLVRHLTPYDPAYTERVAATTAALAPLSGASASQQATALIGQTAWQQAQLAAFVFNFRLFGVLCLCGLPAVFLFQRVRPTAGAAVGH
jgi:MFS transporter, DHA2 family, multidrug resistance protein